MPPPQRPEPPPTWHLPSDTRHRRLVGAAVLPRPLSRRPLIGVAIGAIVLSLGLLVFAARRFFLLAAATTALATATTLPATATASASSRAATPTRTALPATATPALSQRIDAYIDHLTLTQQIGQLLMLPVYANAYSSVFDVPLQTWQFGNVIVFTQYNGGPLEPTTLDGLHQLLHDVQAHTAAPLLIATDEEGGGVDRLAPYYGVSPSPQALAATGDPQQAYDQAKLDAQRLRSLGINADFAPLADVYQGGVLDQSRTSGTTPDQVARFAGAFLDGLQQNGIVGTLKHWPGIGAESADPHVALPTISQSKDQLNAMDFASFQALLPHQPAMIMVTHVLVPAYDTTYPASLSPALVAGVLRGQLGYQGVVVTDAMEMGGIGLFIQSQGYSDPVQAVAQASVLAILAGDDIVECPHDLNAQVAIAQAITSAVQSGVISPTRLRQSLRRIIALKEQMGLVSL